MKPSPITHLYKTFSAYQLNRRITGHYCEVCLSNDYNQFLHDTPLRLLTEDDFLGYLTSVDILDETCNDFKYFLPRLLEIIYESEDQSSYYFDVIWRVLGRINVGTWPVQEQQAIKDFAIAYLDRQTNSRDPLKLKFALEDLEEAGLKHLISTS